MDDITFCLSDCQRTDCYRHPSNIQDRTIPHSYADFTETETCPEFAKDINAPINDSISRQAAIDAVRKYAHYDDFDVSVVEEDVAIIALKDLPSAQPQGWIPVSEALPDRYIVGGDGKHYSQDVLMTVIYRDDDIFIDYGQMVDDEWYSEMDKEIITSPFEVVAWMHLPKCYKGGQDE